MQQAHTNRNLDECDVPPLTDSDFEGCGLNVQIEYIIHRTELCVLISKVLRERFGLRISPDDYNAALGNADEALARWSLTLPPSLQALSSNMTLWTASLHLTYNNFLIILHRPHPKASPRMDDHGANDSEICSSAANAIATIFEDLRTRNQLKFLWISDINALFTTMVQISVELRFSNPILAINALRRFDSSLLSLRNLVEYWTNADWILRIFEESSHVQHGIRLGNSTIRNEQPESSYAGPEFSQQKRGGDEQIARDGTATGDHDCLTQSEDVNQDYQVDQNEWGEMIPQTDSISPDFLMSNDDLNSMLPLDSEWREIYWQEPGISESFGDGLWGWP
jgi:transcriptional regulatory protein AMDR